MKGKKNEGLCAIPYNQYMAGVNKKGQLLQIYLRRETG
jgi:hypothetical protein